MGEQNCECQTVKKCGCEETTHTTGENTMSSSFKDKVEGTFHEVKGSLKEVAGKLSDNPKLQAEGTVEKVAGKIQEKIGQVKQVLGK